jgi:recombination DNA repair RAD52 pathway protein
VSYVEGYHVENEANRIFGFDGWDRGTLSAKCVMERARKIGKGQYEKDGWGVTYVATVRVTVRAGDIDIMRDGTGAGHGIDADLGQAHESAIKEAETDAEKRALKTFGNQFGQALYDKSQSNVADALPATVQTMLAAIEACETKPALVKWAKDHSAAVKASAPAHQTAIYDAYAVREGQINAMDQAA